MVFRGKRSPPTERILWPVHPTQPTNQRTNPLTNHLPTDMTCFFRCLPGMNKLNSYCQKIEFALTSNCHNCPAEIITWAKNACLDYQARLYALLLWGLYYI